MQAQLVRPLASHAAPWLAVDALLELARAYLAIADTAGAQVVLREAEAIVRRRPALGVLTTELVALRRRLADAAATLAGSVDASRAPSCASCRCCRRTSRSRRSPIGSTSPGTR